MAPNWFIGLSVQAPDIEALLGEPPRRVRYFAESDLHLTLAFLGPVERSAAMAAWEVAEEAALERVQGTFAGVKALGNPRKPTAVSALVGEGYDALCQMIGESRSTMFVAAGAREETRPPLPHVTLARIQRRASGAEYREAVEWMKSLRIEGVPFIVDRVALYTWAEDRRSRLFDAVEARALS